MEVISDNVGLPKNGVECPTVMQVVMILRANQARQLVRSTPSAAVELEVGASDGPQALQTRPRRVTYRETEPLSVSYDCGGWSHPAIGSAGSFEHGETAAQSGIFKMTGLA